MDIGSLDTGWRRLQRQIFRRTGSDDAEDLLQTSLVRMLERAAGSISNPEAFLVRSAINEARDRYRRTQHPASPRPLSPEDSQLRDLTPLADESLIARQRLDRIREGLQRLTPRTREVFLMHRLEGRKYREIAEELGISMSAVEKHIAKAMQFLSDWSEGW